MIKTKTLLRARQAKLRDFIKETNAGKNNPILVRDYSREKIVTKIPIIKVNESELISKTVQHYGSFLWCREGPCLSFHPFIGITPLKYGASPTILT